MNINLPSRYEDLSEEYRGRLVPNPELISLVNQANKSMKISGVIRFLPIYGESGSGKSSASIELSTHIPGMICNTLTHEEITSYEKLLARIRNANERNPEKILVFVVDQYEESVQGE